MESCKPILTPIEDKLKLVKDDSDDLVDATNYKRLVGSLQYLTITRPDIMYGVGIVSRFMETSRHPTCRQLSLS